MISVYAKNVVSTDHVDEFIETAKELVEKTNQEKGCIQYELNRCIEEKNVLAFIEKWEDQASLDAHMKSEHFTRIVPQLGKLLAGEMQVMIHEVLF